MNLPIRAYAAKFLFFVWAFAAVVGILTTGKFLVFGAGAFLWLIGNVIILALSIITIKALSKSEVDDFLRMLTGIMATSVAGMLLLTYFFVDRDIYAPLATQPNQLLVLFGVSLATVFYSFWNNEYVRPMTISEFKQMVAHDPDDMTNLDRTFNERVFGSRQVTDGSRSEYRSGYRLRTDSNAKLYR